MSSSVFFAGLPVLAIFFAAGSVGVRPAQSRIIAVAAAFSSAGSWLIREPWVPPAT